MRKLRRMVAEAKATKSLHCARTGQEVHFTDGSKTYTVPVRSVPVAKAVARKFEWLVENTDLDLLAAINRAAREVDAAIAARNHRIRGSRAA